MNAAPPQPHGRDASAASPATAAAAAAANEDEAESAQEEAPNCRRRRFTRVAMAAPLAPAAIGRSGAAALDGWGGEGAAAPRMVAGRRVTFPFTAALGRRTVIGSRTTSSEAGR